MSTYPKDTDTRQRQNRIENNNKSVSTVTVCVTGQFSVGGGEKEALKAKNQQSIVKKKKRKKARQLSGPVPVNWEAFQVQFFFLSITALEFSFSFSDLILGTHFSTFSRNFPREIGLFGYYILGRLYIFNCTC